MSQSLPLADRVAIVTGCGRSDGIGAAIARALSASGAIVVVTDQPAQAGADQNDHLEELASQLGGAQANHLAMRADVRSEADCEAVVGNTVSRFGRIDILVNNAAADLAGDRLPTSKVSLADWSRVLDVNLTGPFLMSRASIPVMTDRRWGRVINISSVAALRGLQSRAAYSASKAGLIGLTRAIAADVASVGITANALCPGAVETSRHISFVLSQSNSQDVRTLLAESGKGIPVGRIGQGSDIANAVVFLANPASGFITGQVLAVDGGSVAIAGRRS